MVSSLKDLLQSKDEDSITQGIELILNLGMAEELESEFKILLNESLGSELIVGRTLREYFTFSKAKSNRTWYDGLQMNADEDSDEDQEEEHYHEGLAKASLLALLIGTGRLGTSVKALTLRPNIYFNKFELLRDLDGVKHLHLIGFDETESVAIVKNKSDLKGLVLNELNTSSLNTLKTDQKFLKLLERGMHSADNIRNSEAVNHLLNVLGITLGTLENRWIDVLRKIPSLIVKKVVNDVSYSMIYCAAGEFLMGSDDTFGWGSQDQHQPQHKVKISTPFLMGKTQVTQALWRAVLGNNPSYFRGKQRPVEHINWLDCVLFCNALSKLDNLTPAYIIKYGDERQVKCNPKVNGYRLPTEAEWEYAARAGNKFLYAGSDQIDEVAWYGDHSKDGTHPVGQKKSNDWGFQDFSGNVWEWCNDEWDDEMYKNLTAQVDESDEYKSIMSSRSFRGGQWNGNAEHCRVAYRDALVPFNRTYLLGFRLIQSVII